ncbi:MAG: prenyltransferase/squalene oxidase repeat-containing protein [Phycisphaerae bacterium]
MANEHSSSLGPSAARLLALACLVGLAASIIAIPLLTPPTPAALPAPGTSTAQGTNERPADENPGADARARLHELSRDDAPRDAAARGIDPSIPFAEERRVFIEPPPALVMPRAPTRSASRPIAERSAEMRRARVQQFGGNADTENTVEAGLSWLAEHQSPDGSWDRVEFQKRCPKDAVCPGPGIAREDHRIRAGITGLCLLAFLGAGYSHSDGPYARVISNSAEALLAMQRPDGAFSSGPAMAGYDNSLATFALAEYYAVSGDARVRVALERAVDRLTGSQQSLGGWDYLPRPDVGRNDTSITGWMTQALLACAAAGIHVPPESLVYASMHFMRATEDDGRVRYADAGTGVSPGPNGLQYRYGPAMIGVAMACEPLLGWRLESPLRRRQAALAAAQLPSATLARGGDNSQLHDEYYWYYGTVAMFQSGGESWERWNAALRDAILPLQNRDKTADGRKKHGYGSWQPYGPGWGRWGRIGGRVYATAICVLTLEIYYRHPPAYLIDEPVLGPGDWRAVLRDAGLRERGDAVRCLRECRAEISEPVLVEMLADSSAAIASAAARALADLGSPMGKSVLTSRRSALPESERALSDRALRTIEEIEARTPPRGVIRVYDTAARVATMDIEGAYVGLLIVVTREGHNIAQMSVIQRYTGRPLALAALRDGDAPQPGDVVEAR